MKKFNQRSHGRSAKVFEPLPEDLRGARISDELLALIPRDIAEELGAFVFAKKGETVSIAALDPTAKPLRDYVVSRFGNHVVWHAATREDVAAALGESETPREDIAKLVSEESDREDGNVVSAVDRMLRFALKEKASDIHIEPTRDKTAIRFRIDGLLQNVMSLPSSAHDAFIARLKLMANLRLDETRRPQEGRIELPSLPDISLRVSTAPTLRGEKVAIRLLDDSRQDLSIRKLGFSETHEKILLRHIDKPYGMIVTSGPTGSGKTTTLYSLLSLLPESGMNVSTLEDPVEYALPNANQIAINQTVGLTFVTGLRALLRQDPDVIMVGEVRDAETASMAANAALTGHLVLTTLHTNDAPSVLTRLLEMDVTDFLVASTVNLVIGQRLVRKVCDKCAVEKSLDPIVFKKISERPDVVAALSALGADLQALTARKVRSGKGCSVCLESGYSGRIGMFELLEMDRAIHDAVLERPSAENIKSLALSAGFREMLLDGLEKALSGQTTFEEVLRATRGSS